MLTVLHGERQRVLLPYQHHQPVGPRERGVEQRPAQQGGGAGHQWQHHGGELGALRRVDGDGVGVGKGEETGVGSAHLPRYRNDA